MKRHVEHVLGNKANFDNALIQGGGGLPCKNDGAACQKFSKTLLKVPKLPTLIQHMSYSVVFLWPNTLKDTAIILTVVISVFSTLGSTSKR